LSRPQSVDRQKPHWLATSLGRTIDDDVSFVIFVSCNFFKTTSVGFLINVHGFGAIDQGMAYLLILLIKGRGGVADEHQAPHVLTFFE
jgi:hypothetical protein